MRPRLKVPSQHSRRCSPRSTGRIRRLFIEALEARRLLAIDAADWLAMKKGLRDDMLPWIEAIEKSPDFQRTIPLVNQTMGEISPLRNILDEVLVKPAEQYIAAHTNSKLSKFINWLPQLETLSHAGLVVESSTAFGTSDDDDAIAKVNFTLVVSQVANRLPLSIASERSKVTLSFDPDELVELRTLTTFSFSFGVELETSRFFISSAPGAGTEVSVTSELAELISRGGAVPHSVKVDAGNVGFVSVRYSQFKDSSINLNVSATSDWPSTLLLRSDSDELRIATFDPERQVVMSIDGVASFGFNVQPQAVQSDGRVGVLLLISKDGIKDIGITDDVPQLTELSRLSARSMSAGLDQVATLLARAANEALPQSNPWLKKLPLLGKSAAEALDLENYFKSLFTAKTTLNPDGSLQFVDDVGLAERLKGFGVSISGPTYTRGPTNNVTDVRYSLHIDTSKGIFATVDLGSIPGLDLPTSQAPQIGFRFDTSFDLTFGQRTSDGMFFVVDTPGPEFQATLSVPNNSLFGSGFLTRLGFTDVTLSNGMIAAGTTLSINLKDSQVDDRNVSPPNIRSIYKTNDLPSSPGFITMAEMQGETPEVGAPAITPYVDLISFSSSTSPLTLTVNVAGTIPGINGFTESGALVVNWPNALDVASYSINTSAIPRLNRFQSIETNDVVATLAELPRVIGQLEGVRGVGSNLPIVGSSIGNQLNLDGQFKHLLTQAGSYTTIQQLQSKFQAALNQAGLSGTLNLSSNSNDLRLVFNLQQAINQTVPVSAQEQLSSLGTSFQFTGNLPISAVANTTLEFGMRFDSTNSLSIDEQFFVAPSSSNAQLTVTIPSTTIATSANIGWKKLAASSQLSFTPAGVLPTVQSVLVDPGTQSSDNRITLGEYKLLPASMLGPAAFAGSASARTTFPVSTTENGQVQLDWSTLNSAPIVVPSPNLTQLASAATSFNEDTVRQGIQSFTNLFSSWEALPVISQKFQVLDKSLGQLVPFIGDLKAAFQPLGSSSTVLNSAVTFNAAVLNMNGSAQGLTIVPSSNPSEHDLNQNRFRYRLVYDRTLPANINLDFGVDGLTGILPTFQTNAHVHVEFEFGVNAANGFFISTNNSAPEVVLELNASPTLSAGHFGPLVIQPLVGQGTQLHVGFNLELENPQHDSPLIPVSLLLNNLASVVRPTVDASADLDFQFSAAIGSDGPSVSTGFEAHWNFVQPGQITFGSTGSTDIRDGIKSVEYSLGPFLNETLGKLLENVQHFNPLPREVNEFLTTSLPIIDVTPLDVILAATGMPKEIGFVFEISSVAGQLNALLGNGGSNEAPPPADDSQLRAFLNKLKRDYDVRLPFLEDIEGSVKDLLLNTGSPSLIEWDPDAFELPISIDSPSIPIAQIGPVTVLMHYGAKFGIKGDFGIGLSTAGLQTTGKLLDGLYFSDNVRPVNQDANEIEAFAQVTMGLSASLLGVIGIYGDGGIRGTIGADLADLSSDNTPVGRCEPGGDGRVTLPELATIEKNFGLDSTLNPNGSISLAVEMGVELLSFFHVPLIQADFPLVEFGDSCQVLEEKDVQFVSVVGNALTVDLNALFDLPGVTSPDEDATRKLEIEPTLDSNKNPTGFDFIVTTPDGRYRDHRSLSALLAIKTLTLFGTDGPDRIVVDPTLTTLLPITSITVATQAQNDTIDFGNIPYNGGSQIVYGQNSLLQSTFIDGGTGDDTIRATFADDTIIGGYGSDKIYARAGNNTIYGDLNGPVTSYFADPTFFYAGGDDITSEDGNDTIHGGWGNDKINAGSGNNFVVGGPGRDQISTGFGTDTVFAGINQLDDNVLSGPDYIVDHGGANNQLYGSPLNDVFFAAGQSNTIWAGRGNDRVQVASGDNEIHGGAGFDTITTGDGIDRIWGDEDGDTIDSGEGNNRVWGGAGNDTITTGGGQDQIFGEDNNDTIFAGSGIDIVSGGKGDDEIHGQYGDDWLLGDEDNDKLYGENGNDLLDPGSGPLNLVDGGSEFDIFTQAATNVQRLSMNSVVGFGSSTHANIEYFRLNGTADSDQLFISDFAGSAVFNAGGSVDAIFATTTSMQVLLSDWNLTLGSNASVRLNSVESASVEGSASDDTFDIKGWSGAANILGGAGRDTLVDSRDGDFTLTDSDLTRSALPVIQLSSIDVANLSGGLGNNTIDAAAFSGETKLLGGDGDDTIRGGSNFDIIEGGFGADFLFGNAGDDRITAGPGVGGSISGGPGNDQLYGSEDGWDSISGDTGNDEIWGGAGNDILRGGPDDDTIHGGMGDDNLSGDEGADLLLGEAGNDVLYAFRSNPSDGPGAVDRTVNYLYGDFATNNNEPGSGNDDLIAAQGNDVLYGEGSDDRLQGGAASTQYYYGTGEGPDPFSYNVGPATPPPTPLQPTGIRSANASLPTGASERGRWTELANSASGFGLSGDRGLSLESSIAVNGSGQYVAWADNRNGNFEIYVAYFNGVTWQELAQSASNGGISSTSSDSRQPAIALDAQNRPVVVWVENIGTAKLLRASRFVAEANAGQGAWEALDDVAGLGLHEQPHVVATSSGIVVAWLHTDLSNVVNVFAKRLDGTAWQEIGAGSASGRGISQSPVDVSGLALASDGTNLAVAWSQSGGGSKNIYVKQSSGGAWNEIAGSASGAGISASSVNDNSITPSLTYFNNRLVAVWSEVGEGGSRLRAAETNGATWSTVDVGNTAPTPGAALPAQTLPRLAVGGGRMHLLWIEDRLANHTGNTLAIYARVWQGNAFASELPFDSLGEGISGISEPQNIAVAVDASGHPFVTWTDLLGGSSEIYLRANTFDIGNVYYVNDDSPNSDVFSRGLGAANNDGKSWDHPQLSLERILNAYDLEPGDVILVDTSAAAPNAPIATVSVTAQDSGILIQGTNRYSSSTRFNLQLSSSSNVTVRGLDLNDLTLQQSPGTSVVRVSTTGPVKIVGGSNQQILKSSLGSLTISGGAVGSVIEQDQIGSTTSVIGLQIDAGGAIDLLVQENLISGINAGVINASFSGTIRRNRFAGPGISMTPSVGLNIAASYSGRIEDNEVRNAFTGLICAAPGFLSGNLFTGHRTGVTSTLDGIDALGFVGNTRPNTFSNNQFGAQLDGNMQGQILSFNDIGVRGNGRLIPSDLAHANLIDSNIIGVQIAGNIQFNRIARNQTGIVASANQLIANNLVYRNSVGVSVNNKNRVNLWNNTYYTQNGDNVRIENNSSEIDIRNNIMWTADGYDIIVSDDSATGIYSDYNLLHASGSGKLVYWAGEYADILDWQENVHQFDLHSRGTTVVNPTWSQPRFVSLRDDNFEILPPVSQLRFTSPSIDAGDPRSDLITPAGYDNLLINAGFEQGITGWTAIPSGTTRSASPTVFAGFAYFDPGVNSTTTLTQLVALGAVANGQTYAVYGGRIRSASETRVDRGQLQIEFLDTSGSVLGSHSTAAENATQRWELVGGRTAIPVGTRSIRYTYTALRQTGSTNDAYLDNAFLRIISSTDAPDLGAYGNATTENQPQTVPVLKLRAPDLYRDWEKDKQLPILWETFGNDNHSPVRIDLYQDSPEGPRLLVNLSPGAADTGKFNWIPSTSGLDFGTYGLRIQVRLVDYPTAIDRSTETFTVPENTNTFFVNDNSNQNNSLTTNIGSNRNTGKLPQFPKPLPTNVLRIYNVGAAATLQIDPGAYPLPTQLVLSNVADINDDEGFTFTGSATSPAVLYHANPLTVAATLDIYDADLITLANLEISKGLYGIRAHDGATQLSLHNVTISGATLDGLRADTGAQIDELDRVRSLQNGRNGLFSDSSVGWIHDSSFSANVATGISLSNPGGVRIETNQVASNSGNGIWIQNSGSATPATIGNGNLSLGKGNWIYGNGGSGVLVNGATNILGNTIYGQTSFATAGIMMSSTATATGNVVFSNYEGINAGGTGNVVGNRIHNNATNGVQLSAVNSLRENVIYSNPVGVRMRSGNSTIENNLIYGSSDTAILANGLLGSGTKTIKNNTLYQPAGDGIRIESRSANIGLRNNIIWVQAGHGISVSADSQTGLTSDTNLIYATASGRIGSWQGISRATLEQWRSASQLDANSLSLDPQLVDVDGPDNILGYFNDTFSGVDDDFHLKSLTGSLHGGSLAPYVTVIPGSYTLPLTTTGTLTTDNAMSPALNRGNASDNFALEPVPNGNFIDLGNYGNTHQASLSPSEYLLVTTPDGGEIWVADQTYSVRWRSHNFSGTVHIDLINDAPDQNSTQRIASDVPNNGLYAWTIPASIVPGANYRIRVTSVTTSGLVDISDQRFTISQPVSVFYVNDNTVEAGDWTTAPGNDANSGLSPNAPKATIQALLSAYALGPGSIIRIDSGDYLLSTNVVITAADAGVTLQGFADSTQPGKRTLINRGNQSSGSYAIQLQNADNVTLSNLQITGGFYGIAALNGSDSDGVTIQNSHVFYNSFTGIYFEATNDTLTVNGNTLFGADRGVSNNDDQRDGVFILGDNAQVTNNSIFDSSDVAIEVGGGGTRVTQNRLYNNRIGIVANFSTSGTAVIDVSNNTAFNNHDYGIDASGAQVRVRNNVIYGNIGVSGNQGFGWGMRVSAADVSNNTIYGNIIGINANGGSLSNNRIYANYSRGVAASGTIVRGNTIFSNPTGIAASSNATIENNVVYDNRSDGVLLTGSSAGSVTNNTVFQRSGNAIRLASSATNVKLLNNILQVESGVVLNVASDSQSGFQSDYNTLYAAGSGLLALWNSQPLLTVADLIFQVGIDRHSLVSDPQLVNVRGADGILGFDSTPSGIARYFDDSQATLSGSWQNNVGNSNSAYNRMYTTKPVGLGDGTVTWNLTGLIPGQTYRIDVSTPGNTSSRPFQVFDNGQLLANLQVSPFANVGLFTERYDFNDAPKIVDVVYHLIGYFTPTDDSLQVRLTDKVNGTTVEADVVRIQPVIGFGADDDDLHISHTSPTRNAGDPLSYYLGERMPSGARVDAGAYGNTSQTPTSAAQTVQVVSPNGYEKIEQGTALPISIQTSGLTTNEIVGLINVGGGVNGRWLADRYRTGGSSVTTTAAINTSALSNPAPIGVYQAYAQASTGIGNELRYQLPVPDGNYSIRLHFIEPNQTVAGARKFDIRLQGSTIQAGYDIFAAAGGTLRAIAPTYSTSVQNGAGLLLQLVNTTSNGAVLSAIELFAANASAVTNPTVNLEVSSDDGQTWSALATGVPVDRFGQANYLWNVPSNQAISDRMRVMVPGLGDVSDVTDQSFQVASGGTSYFLQSGSSAFEYSSALGNDNNSGKSPNKPMASIAALLAAYDLDPGDVIYVDPGTYNLLGTVFIDNQDSGVRIQGPSSGVALFDRGGTSTNTNQAFELRNADNVTFDRVSITGAYYGIYAASGSDSDGLTVSGSTLFNNYAAGVSLGTSNDGFTIRESIAFGTRGGLSTDNHIFGNIMIDGINATVLNNTLNGSNANGSTSAGVRITGAGASIEGNKIYDNVVGIDAISAVSALIANNEVFNNTTSGILAGRSTVAGNTVYGHTGTSQAGIQLYSEGIAKNNIVYGNYFGIQGGQVITNEIWGNTSAGVALNGTGSVINNNIHHNVTGIFGDYGNSGPFAIRQNVLANNSLRALYFIDGSYGTDISNNTIYQPTGDAFELRTGKNRLNLQNNIVVVGAGYAVKDSGDSQIGFVSDYNAFHLTGSAKQARWQGQDIASLNDWRYLLGLDMHSQQVDPQFVSVADSDFRVLSSSPTIDAGSPDFYYLAEPLNNGGRINQGHTGNTPLAAASPLQSIQFVTLNGRDKVEQSETTRVNFRTSGLAEEHMVALINAGGSQVDNWLANNYRSDSGTIVGTVSTTINTSQITRPVPASIFQSYAQANSGIGQRLSYALPVPNGTYTLRLYFVEPTLTTANGRRFDILLQGNTVAANLDLFVAAGGQLKAIERVFTVTATDGNGITLDLVNLTSTGAILSGLELTRTNLLGVASPTFKLELSSDNGAAWTPLATNIAVDRFGRASYDWNVPANLSIGDNYRLRASGVQSPTIVGRSDTSFQIAAAGNHFYVNDGSQTNDSLTSQPGNDASDGKSSARPMRTLAALVDAYKLGAGDIIHIDSGNYLLLRNIVLTADDSGVEIEGPINRDAVLNRGYAFNYTAPNGFGGQVQDNYAFELRNADAVTLRRLSLTGAFNAISADTNSDSDDFRLIDSTVSGNYWTGLLLNSSNDRAQLTGNLFYGIPGGSANDNQARGMDLGGSGVVVAGNILREHGTSAIVASDALKLSIMDNDIFGNQTGISTTLTSITGSLPENRQTIRNNSIHDNTSRGAQLFGNILFNRNKVYGHSAANLIGVIAQSGVEVSENIVFNNAIGVTSSSNQRVSDNRVYNNSSVGLQITGSGPVERNQVYSNSIGLQLSGSASVEAISNVVYANTNTGILVTATGTTTTRQLLNNTIQQPIGNALRIEGASTNTVLRNNIISVQAGVALSLATDSQTGFDSNFNLIQTTPASSVGVWSGVTRTTLADWRSASSGDSRSLSGDPQWVDIDGADNIFGYAFVGGQFKDGGLDDNFYLAKASAAIDAGEPSVNGGLDRELQTRRDDPATPNSGVTSYNATVLSGSQFTTSGLAKTWRGDATSFAYTLPFAFPFYDGSYTSLFVSTEGFVQFVNSTNAGSGSNSTIELAKSRRIAPLWDDLRTNGTGDDIFIDESAPGQVTIRWNATTNSSTDVQFALVLMASGQMRFDYGPGTATTLSPTVGVSMGNTRAYVTVPGYDAAVNLTNRPSVLLIPDGIIFDLGAYEFRGTRADVTAPRAIAALPSGLFSSGNVPTSTSTITLTFNEEINAIDAAAIAAYELRFSGANGLFNDSDDVVYGLTPSYTIGQNSVTLQINNSSAMLPAGSYRLTVYGQANTALHDLAGLRLDGNADGIEGGDYQAIFRVNNRPELQGLNNPPAITEDISNADNSGTTIGQLLSNNLLDSDGPGRGLAIVSASDTNGQWQYSLDGLLWQAVATALTSNRLLLLAADADSRIRFLPSPDFFGTSGSIIVRGWDQADGLAEGSSVAASNILDLSLSSQTTTFSIVVTPVNDAPSAIAISNNTISENLPPGSLIGQLSATDVDAGESFVYALVDGDGAVDNASFSLQGNSLKLAKSLDLEAKPLHSIRVRVTDSHNVSFEQVLSIQLIDRTEVDSIVVGSGIQRSMVHQLLVTFDGLVEIADLNSSAFTVRKRGPDGGLVVTTATVSILGNKTQVRLAFAGSFVESNGSLKDGNYDLIIRAASIRRANTSDSSALLDGDRDGIAGGDRLFGSSANDQAVAADAFFRLYGDTNGDGLVGVAEFGEFRSSFGKTSTDAGYNALFDFDSIGAVGVSDFGQFRSRFGKSRILF